MAVDCPGDELFAGSAFAGDEHGHAGGGDECDALEELLHRGGRPDDRFGIGAWGSMVLAVLRVLLFQGSLDDRGCLIEVEWLDEVFEGAPLDGPDGSLQIAECGDD